MLQYNACIEGASDFQRDRVAIAVQGAFYTAYWQNAKHSMSLDRVLRKIRQPANTSGEKPDVDVEAFQEQYRRFEEHGGFKKRNQDS